MDTKAPFFPVDSLENCPPKERLNTFSFRAECNGEAIQFFAAVEALGYAVSVNVHKDADGLPDVEVEIQTDANLEQLQEALRTLEDAHVMLQTLRQLPLDANSLERDYDLHSWCMALMGTSPMIFVR